MTNILFTLAVLLLVKQLQGHNIIDEPLQKRELNNEINKASTIKNYAKQQSQFRNRRQIDNLSVDLRDKTRSCFEHIQSRLSEISAISNIPSALVLENRYPISISIQIPDVICGCNSKQKSYMLTNENNQRKWGFKINVSTTNGCNENDSVRPLAPTPAVPETTLAAITEESKTEVKVCDAAILQCCHKPVVERRCFTSAGCNIVDFSQNICNPTNILNAIKTFSMHYKSN